MDNTTSDNPAVRTQADALFEISWEVCNKVGGIYTVLTSKSGRAIDCYNGGYFTVGPYFEPQIRGQFQPEQPNNGLRAVFDGLEKEKIKCFFGKWLVGGQPKAILLDFHYLKSETNLIKAKLWEDWHIDSLKSGPDFDEPVVWAWAAGKLLEKMPLAFPDKKIVAHFHEWLSGAGLLHLKKQQAKIGTVFTTHATTLGRTLAFNNINPYVVLDKINPEEGARNYSVIAKHLLERQTAQQADVFTTVSEIAALEAEKFLGRKPDFVLPNGLDLDKYPTFEETSINHRLQRDLLRDFTARFFFPYHSFDLANTLFYFTASRYEIKAKGIDIFIKALGQLNKKLSAGKNSKTIVAFFWVPIANKNVKPEVLQNCKFFAELKDILEENSEEIRQRVLYLLSGGQKIEETSLFRSDLLLEIKKKVSGFKRQGNPPLSTHELQENQTEILRLLRESGLANNKNDKVKVVLYPAYLTGYDGLSNLTYQESIQACHLGVFPSFYEPWGYTPLEAAALGVPSVTTDLTGFGKHIKNENSNKETPGVFVLQRENKTEEESAGELAKILFNFAKLKKVQRVENKIEARKIALGADWKNLMENYIKAQNQAVEKANL
ncbi:MAG: glycosyltransferase [Patescibacteria group bacterium]|nr:glycosyltransferase [Patescibacteria group bacterium]